MTYMVVVLANGWCQNNAIAESRWGSRYSLYILMPCRKVKVAHPLTCIGEKGLHWPMGQK